MLTKEFWWLFVLMKHPINICVCVCVFKTDFHYNSNDVGPEPIHQMISVCKINTCKLISTCVAFQLVMCWYLAILLMLHFDSSYWPFYSKSTVCFSMNWEELFSIFQPVSTSSTPCSLSWPTSRGREKLTAVCWSLWLTRVEFTFPTGSVSLRHE